LEVPEEKEGGMRGRKAGGSFATEKRSKKLFSHKKSNSRKKKTVKGIVRGGEKH